MRFSGSDLVFLCALAAVSCAAANGFGGTKACPTASSQDEVGFTPRPEGGLDYGMLLSDSLVVRAFKGYGLDPQKLPEKGGNNVNHALFRALEFADTQVPPRPDLVNQLSRICELVSWEQLRGSCLHRQNHLPDALQKPEQADLDEINRRFFPQVLGMKMPDCEGSR